MLKLTQIFLTLLIIPFTNHSQNFVEAKVVDVSNGFNLKNIEISVDGKKIYTDENGNFKYETKKFPVDFVINDNRFYSKKITANSSDKFKVYLIRRGIILEDIIIKSELFSSPLKDISLSTSVLNDIELRKENGEFIINSLNEISGLHIHSAGYNTNRITIRGMGSRSPYSTNKIKAYLNNIPLSNGVGEISLEDFGIQMLGQVEVLKGPNSSLYGSGLGGNILLRTNSNFSDLINFHSSLKSFNTYQNSLSLSKEINDFKMFFNVEKINSEGYRENNTYENLRGILNLNYKINLISDIEFIQFYNNANALIPSSLSLSNYLENPSSAAFSWKKVRGGENYKRQITGLTYNLNIPYVYSQSTSLYYKSFINDEMRPFNFLDEKSKIFGIRHFGKINISKSQLIYGFDYSKEDYKFITWDNYGEDDQVLITKQIQKRNNYNIFTQYNLPIKDFSKLIFGISLNNIKYDWTCCNENQIEELSYQYKNIISPRLSYNFKKNNKSYFINISHGYSPPNIDETLDENGLVNPDIKPETGINYEIGVLGSSKNNNVSYNINMYYMDIKNLLVAQRTDFDTFTGVNAGRTSHPGIETSVNFQVLKSKDISIISSNNFSKYWYIFRDFIDKGNDYSQNKLTGVPSHTIFSKLKINLKNYLTQISFQNIGKIPINDSNKLFTDAYSIVDFTFSKLFSLTKFDVNISSGINNVFNKKYASGIVINARGFGGRDPRYYYPGLPRNYFISLNLRI
ncbi:MAG: TonB-dependent receptor plug domain-containing protein [Flammeovirgaceae bacterium]